ncbi:ThuA domain-containing protein [Pedobacter heparinus]|uniref:Crp/FNR family transcriptional regulator n=1 Tax=Pedobacter heparinus (strain ATCC 13125 / DSM 2366 / CIP 104194 / JCM 7457 / NBRC 12017 / NCIMB 9290 / NRRL B-14731 / HIM 762-3) TaxID=485917 RepID=C6Y1H7_PEDHD|nr:ThuA domain-containing protein [Pedobacter heparinus]ACU02953.1 Crp/FNR family transcriptional regulator [Pedobacter heparinus DSM 2366]
MFKNFHTLVIATLLVLFFVGPAAAKKKKVLVFSKTAGYHHASIKVGVPAIQKLGLENKFEVDSTIDAGKFTAKNLKQYAAVIFLNTTGDVLNNEQQAAFEQYIKNGGGYVGVHAATDTEYEWPWYGKLAGAYFINHPAQQEAVLNVVNRNTIATRHLPQVWKRKDEWYNFKDLNPEVKVLITIDENSYKGGKNSPVHPMAWYHDFEGGRSFYTELGHVDESYTDPLFLQHLLGGIQYAMGVKKME